MRRRPAFAAGFTVALFVVGQLVALKHDAETRHVTCAQHGEQLDAPAVAGTSDDCGQSQWIPVGKSGGEHEDCSIARLLRTRTKTSEASLAHVVITIVAKVEASAPIAHARSVDVLLIAPKTSPPV
jgi:hypothetical protein